MRHWFRESRYASVTSTLALIVALGGTSYAAVALPKNSVGARQIKKNAVTSSEVKNRSLVRRDFKAGQLPAGPRGPKGDTGAQGPKGDKGDTGPAGPITGTVPSGVTLRGAYAIQGPGTGGVQARQGVSFGLRFATAPTGHFIRAGDPVPAGCTGGTAAAPEADPGHLCIYEADTTNVGTNRGIFDPVTDGVGTARVWGFGVYSAPDAASAFRAQGSWAATAP